MYIYVSMYIQICIFNIPNFMIFYCKDAYKFIYFDKQKSCKQKSENLSGNKTSLYATSSISIKNICMILVIAIQAYKKIKVMILENDDCYEKFVSNVNIVL